MISRVRSRHVGIPTCVSNPNSAMSMQYPLVVGGAGGIGCAIALVHKDHIDAFKANVAKVYTEEIGYDPSFYIAEIADGAH